MKQGAILSPLFYSLFVNELLVALEKSGLGVKIGSVYCSAPMYADDLALIVSSAEELQAMMDVVSQYATKWNVILCACAVVNDDFPGKYKCTEWHSVRV